MIWERERINQFYNDLRGTRQWYIAISVKTYALFTTNLVDEMYTYPLLLQTWDTEAEANEALGAIYGWLGRAMVHK